MNRLVARSRLWLLLLALLVAACLPGGTPVAVTTGLHVWLDQPPDGAALPLGVFTLRAHAQDGAGAGTGVETITFLVSSGGPPVTVGSVTTDPAQPLVTADFDWNPSAPGAYTIQAQAFDRAGYVFSVPARVCVGLAPAAGRACAAPGPAGVKLQGLVLSDLNADGDAADTGEGPLAGVLVTLSGCDTQTVHTNPPSSDPEYPEGVFAFGVTSLSGCSIQVALAGYHFEAFEGSTTDPIAWPAEEAPHTILMAPAGLGTATASPAATATAAVTATPSGTTPASVTPTQTALASATPTKKATPKTTPSATPSNSVAPTDTSTAVNLPSDTPTRTEQPAATATATPKPADTPLPTATKPPAPTATVTQPPKDTAPPTIAKVSAVPNPTFYGDACTKGQDQFTASAAVTDPSGVTGVTLFYRYGVNGSSGAWQSVGMSAAGGDQYSVNVHNDAAAVYKLLGGVDGYVEYYVQAQDSLGNAGQSPSPVITIQYCLG